MFTISDVSLLTLGLKQIIMSQYAEALNQACKRFDINTPQRAAAFVGQCMVESKSFADVEEDLFYTTPERILKIFPSYVKTLEQAQTLVRNEEKLANVVYANRMGNGDEASGDGFRFHGRGPIQTTGRANYTAAAAACDRPYTELPALLKLPADGCLASAFFWKSNSLNEQADKIPVAAPVDQYVIIDKITRRINRGMLGSDERRLQTLKAMRIFQAQS